MWLTLRLCLYAALLWGLNWSFGTVFPLVDRSIEYGRSVSVNIAAMEMDSDILFIGDSRTQQGLDPIQISEILSERTGRDVTARNLGRPGMPTPFYYFTLERYLAEATEAPDTIYIAPSYYLLHGYEWVNKIYLASFEPLPHQAEDAVASGFLDPATAALWRLRASLPLARHAQTANDNINRLIRPDPAAILKELDDNRHVMETLTGDEFRGFFPRGEGHIEPRTRTGGRVFQPGLADPVFIEYFVKFLQLAEAHGIRVIVFEHPWPEVHRTERDLALQAHYRGILEDAAQASPNARFIDYDPFLPHELFVNPLHLNSRGAETLTALAAEWYLDPATDARIAQYIPVE